MMSAKKFLVWVFLVSGLLIAGCVNYGSVDGVSNIWREIPVEQFQQGVTTQSNVLKLLGPPSQMIALHDQTVFYYLAQESKGQGKIFIVWNQAREENLYDRAIFFFDTEGILQEVSYSEEAIAR